MVPICLYFISMNDSMFSFRWWWEWHHIPCSTSLQYMDILMFMHNLPLNLHNIERESPTQIPISHISYIYIYIVENNIVVQYNIWYNIVYIYIILFHIVVFFLILYYRFILYYIISYYITCYYIILYILFPFYREFPHIWWAKTGQSDGLSGQAHSSTVQEHRKIKGDFNGARKCGLMVWFNRI